LGPFVFANVPKIVFSHTRKPLVRKKEVEIPERKTRCWFQKAINWD